MRVVGGAARGKRLSAFKGLSIRPTSEMVREAIFDMLRPYLPFTRVLDIFAGTGAMGIEAISCGAKEAVFVDNNPKASLLIKKNLEICGFLDCSRVLRMDAIDAVRLLSKRHESFDIVFIDPPYNESLTGRVMRVIEERKLLSPGGVIVSETSKKAINVAAPLNLRLFKRKIYGDTSVSFYKYVRDSKGSL